MKPNGTAIRALRKARNAGLRKLSRETGLDRGYLSRLERGLAGARAGTVERIAAALEVPTAAITHEEQQ
ncbi:MULTISPECIES: helix-turn-helix domain-containing protein [Actinomycetes]|uniref:helix-turn-helix domain-containing protein n=1 Tax=Actinomycetes TaxID=1760 RepID=UPI0033CEF9DE